MYNASLHRQLVEAHVQELHRSRQTWSSRPVTTMSRTTVRKRRRLQLSIYLPRFAGHPGPEAPAF